MMNCIECGQDNLEPALVRPTGAIRGQDYTIEMQGLKCPSCGYETIEGSQMAEFGRLVADQYRQHHGLLTSVDIRSRRKRLGMTQEEFARHLGVGIASVKRWEMGKIQDQRSNECIIRKTTPQAAINTVYTFSMDEQWENSALAALSVRTAESTYTVTCEGGILYYAGAYNTNIPILGLGPPPICHGLIVAEEPSQAWWAKAFQYQGEQPTDKFATGTFSAELAETMKIIEKEKKLAA